MDKQFEERTRYIRMMYCMSVNKEPRESKQSGETFFGKRSSRYADAFRNTKNSSSAIQ